MKNIMALDTLFYPFEAGTLPWPEQGQRVLFLNAQYHNALSYLPPEGLRAQQFFAPYAAELGSRGYAVEPAMPEEEGQFDVVLLAAPKNQIETQCLIASGLQYLKPDGLFIAAADNKAGGSRLVKNLTHFGLKDVQSETRNKCRCSWSFKQGIDDKRVISALDAGSAQPVMDGQFQSWPGIYGWNKIDQGSALLLQHLPDDRADNLKGRGADFGCGYGLLSHHVLQKYDVKSLACIDADWRAVEMCKINIGTLDAQTDLVYEWSDLTQDQPGLKNLDFVVMNPPFHEGKAMDISIGKRFITAAHQSLKRNGVLWMVANKQLSYESTLADNFFAVEKVFEGGGFKVFCATK